jgi:hypothetical protein
MQYYKKINIQYQETIIEKIKIFLYQKNYVETDTYGFTPLNFSEVVNYCPELFVSLLSHKLKIISVSLYKSLNNNNPIHIDNVKNYYKCRINIPILNCQGTHTVFYKATPINLIDQGHNNISLIRCIDEVEVDRVTIDQPTIIRVDQPHKVIMDEQHSPRICLTVRCDPDPFVLLDKE